MITNLTDFILLDVTALPSYSAALALTDFEYLDVKKAS